MTQILKNDHKSGINQNNIKVATVTEDQVQSRALNSRMLPILTPSAPIVATTQVYQVSRINGAITYPTYVNCDDNNRIFCKVTVTAGAKFKSITKALLKIRKYSGSEQGFAVFPASASMVELSVKPTNFVKTVTENNVAYAVIDISDYVKSGKSQEFHIAIQSNQGNILTLYNTASLEVAYVEDDDLIPAGKLEKQVGSKGGYSINARNGKLQYNQQIFASKGGLMPFGLSLSYNASNCDASSPNGVANGMKGWTFNYQQSLKESLGNMLYVDASNVVHTFKHPTNNTDVWYDATGKNGIVLVATSNGYTMSDGKTTTLNFDTSKRLVSIVQKLSDSKNATTTIEYESDGKISKVTDGLGDVYNFVWTDALVQIKKADTLLAEITLASEQVAQVKYSLSGDTVNFTYDANGQLVSALDSASHQKALFEYNTIGAISAVKNYFSQENDVATDSSHFEYRLLQTRVASCRNSDVKNNAYCTMAYMFAEDGELLTTAEVKPDTLKPLRYRTKLDFEKASGTVPDKVIAKALFSSQESIEATSSVSSDIFALDTRNQVFNTYMFNATALVSTSDNVSNDGSQKLTVQIWDGDTIVGSAEFDPSKREQEMVCGYITLSKAQHSLKAVLIFENLNAKVTFGNVQLYSTKNGVQKQCVNVPVSNNSVTEHDGSTSKPRYEQSLCDLKYGDTTLGNVLFTSKDYALTLISRLQNPTAFNVWYNDGKNMLYQVSNVTLSWGTVTKAIGEVQVCTVSSTIGKTLFEYVMADSTYLYKKRNVTTISVDDGLEGVVAEEFVNANFQTAKVVDEKGISTVYTYDANGSVTKVVTTAPTGGLLNIEETSTYHDNNLIKTSRSKRYLTEYVHSYVYGTDYELTQETQPNEQATNFAYSADKDKLTSIFSTVDEATSQNDITYDGDLVDTLSDTRTAVDFDYDERHNISQVKIGGAVVLSKEITCNANGSTQSVTTYGNGQKIKKYYDRFDRLVKVSDVTEDETALVQYVYSDTEISQTDFDPDASFATSANSPLRVVVDHAARTTTWYTYDELGQVKKTQRQNLTTYQTRDEFNRVSIVTHSLGGNIATNYTYASPTDDTLVAESTGGDIPTPFSTTYARDGLQRPTETTVMVGSYGHRQALEYVPRQGQEKQFGGGDIAFPGTGTLPSFQWVTVDEGTTQYVSEFREYNMSGTTATLARRDAVEYDANGNITKYGNVTYEYDKLGRLTKEINPTIDRIKVWCYDISGNILSRTEYAYTTGDLDGVTPTNTFVYEYESGWKDQLKSFNGQVIKHDQAGNPTTYRGATLSWTRGRLLKSYNSITMEYNADGIRTRKVVPVTNHSTTTEYIYSGNNLLQEKVTVGAASQASTTYRAYIYNSQGIIGFVQGGNTYSYRKNLFGDIVAIYQGATKVAEYAYDAWGNCTIVSDTAGIGASNPFRYRGYYWDNDLQLYYLISRYYDPATGRFINADSLEYLDPETIGGINLYVYCGNNPVMGVDPEGTSTFISIFKIVGSVVLVAAAAVGALYSGNVQLAGAAIGGAIGMVSSLILDTADGVCDLESIADAMFSGATTGIASGFLASTGVGLGGQIVGNALITSADYAITKFSKGEEIDPLELLAHAAIGAISGLAGGPGLMSQSKDIMSRITVEILRKEGLKATKKLLPSLLMAGASGGFVGAIKNMIWR